MLVHVCVWLVSSCGIKVVWFMLYDIMFYLHKLSINLIKKYRFKHHKMIFSYTFSLNSRPMFLFYIFCMYYIYTISSYVYI